MQKYIAFNLLTDTMKRTERKPVVCFFIPTKKYDDEFIKQIALEFIEQSSWYHFYGQDEPKWHMIFDETDIMLDPDFTEETIAMTCGYDDLEEFADMMDIEIHSKHTEPTDIFLFYDDEQMYAKLKELLVLLEEEVDRTP